jgi:hypothetical protein
MSDEDTYDAQCAQRDQEERRWRQDEWAHWAQESKLEFQRQIDEWQNDFNERQRRIEHGDHGERERR